MIDYVKEAESNIKQLSKDKQGKLSVTTNQLRKFLAISNAINNEVEVIRSKGELGNDGKLPQNIINKILGMKVKLVYQSARESAVNEFVEKTELIQKIDKISNYDSFKQFSFYVEALTAYHKFEEVKKPENNKSNYNNNKNNYRGR